MTAQAVPLNDAATASLGLCDNDCGRPAVSGFGRGLYKHCSRACERANVTTFDRETVRQLRQESEAAMAVAARDSAKDVAALEAAEAERAGKVRVKVPIAPKVAPAPVAAPIQAADVVVAESKHEPAGEPVKRPYVLRPQSQPRPFVVRPESEQRPGVCRRAGCTRKPRARDLCTSCHTTACQRGIVDLVGAPVKPSSERDLSRDQSDSIRARIEVMASEKPGIHADDIASALGVSRRQVVRAILHLRNSQRLAKSATTRNDPNHLCVYPPSSPKTTHICTVRKP